MVHLNMTQMNQPLTKKRSQIDTLFIQNCLNNERKAQTMDRFIKIIIVSLLWVSSAIASDHTYKDNQYGFRLRYSSMYQFHENGPRISMSHGAWFSQKNDGAVFEFYAGFEDIGPETTQKELTAYCSTLHKIELGQIISLGQMTVGGHPGFAFFLKTKIGFILTYIL